MSLATTKKETWTMFNKIARRYDLLNRLISMGQDTKWRRQMGQYMPDRSDMRLLDLATGTADVAITLIQSYPQLKSAIGLDMSEDMLRKGKEKVAEMGLSDQLSLELGNAESLPFEDAEFDVVTISFGARNIEKLDHALREMKRVLNPGGKVIILESSLPNNPILKSCAIMYLRHILPKIGRLCAGNGDAYQYLADTIQTFPYGEAFCAKLHENGFINPSAEPVFFGASTIYHAESP